jgi:HPt (histidine-containing phosphotransfer) domain-containing protein
VNAINQKKLMESCMGDMQLARSMNRHFGQLLETELPALKEAIESQDAQALRLAAHSLKGAAGYLAAEGAQKLAASLEAAGKAALFAEAPKLLADLEAELARCTDELSRMVLETVES